MSPRPTALVFPGQGSQRPGMLDALIETDSLPRLLDAAEALSGLPLAEIAENGPAEALTDTRAAQPLLYLADWAWGRALLGAGIRPFALAGHSLGELVALAIADVYSVEAGLELVIERSRLMAEATSGTPGAMAAVVGLDAPTISAAVETIDSVWVANDNSPGQVVISGESGAVSAASQALVDLGARKVVPLAVSGAFHSPLVSQAANAFAEVLDAADFADAAIPVVQNAEPAPAVDAATIKARLARQMVSPVRWTETMQALSDAASPDTVLIVEAGPGSVLTGLAKRTAGVEGLSVEQSGIENILEEVERGE